VDEISTGISAFKAVIDARRGMLALSKEVKDAMPEGAPQKKAFERALNEFDASAETFKVELAKEVGLPALPMHVPADNHAPIRLRDRAKSI
jgi:hypothetical protein